MQSPACKFGIKMAAGLRLSALKPPSIGRVASVLAGVPAGKTFGQNPVRNSWNALNAKGVKPLRLAGYGAFGVGTLGLGSKGYDAAKSVAAAPDDIAKRIGAPLGLPQHELDGLAGDIRTHALGAMGEMVTPSFLRTNDTPAAQQQRAVVRSLVLDHARNAVHDAMIAPAQGGFDRAMQWIGYRTPASAAITAAPQAAAGLIGRRDNPLTADKLQQLAALDPRTPLGQHATALLRSLQERTGRSWKNSLGNQASQLWQQLQSAPKP